jgi:colanic acid biosynthesis glycosyl transferase WcaI
MQDPAHRLLIVALNFPPELTGIGKYVGEMSEHLTALGIEIRVITAPPYYPAWSVQRPYAARRYVRERLAGAEVWRCPLYVPRRPRGMSRLVHLASFAISSLPLIVWQALRWRPHTVFLVEPPLACAPAALLAARLCGARSWLHVQDFEVDAALGLGMLGKGALGRLALGVERALLRRFDRVSTISGNMLAKLAVKGVPAQRQALFPNWVDTQLIHPSGDAGRLRAELGIEPRRPVALYSGNMGEKQGLELILEVARRLQGHSDALFLMCGDGAARPRLELTAAALPNVRFIPLQPAAALNDLLNLATVHVLPQRAGAEDLVLPSKLTAIMASGRPVVATARVGSEVERVAGRAGVVVPPEDPAALAEAILALLADPAACARHGENGRAYAVEHCDRRAILDRIGQELLAADRHRADTSDR